MAFETATSVSLTAMLKKSWWKDRHDSPVFLSQLDSIRRSVAAVLAEAPGRAVPVRLEGRVPEAGHGGPVLMACCDEGYFYRFGRQLALSCMLKSPESRLHLHIYNPGPLCIADAEFLQQRLGPHLTISHEGGERNPYPGHAPFFFAAARFAAAAAVMERCHAPVMIIDVDGVVQGNLAPELDSLALFDAGLMRRPERVKPWRQILACAVYVNCTAAGREFLDDLSRAVALSLTGQPAYHVDQTAIFFLLAAYAESGHALSIAELGQVWGDHDFSPASLIWSAKGARKRDFNALSLQQARHVILGAQARA